MSGPKSKAELDRDIEDALESGEPVAYWPAIPSTTVEVSAWGGTAKRAKSTKAPKAQKARKAKPSPLEIVQAAVSSAPGSARYGRGNVFVYPLWKRVKAKLGMSLEQFKHWLVHENRAHHLVLARADMVDDMDPELVEKSEISDLGAQFHFVIDRAARQREHWF